MICKYVSREDVRAIKTGQTAIFTLPDLKAVFSARAQFSILKRLEGLNFERVTMEQLKESLGNDFATVVPDESLTIAYKRIN